MEKIFHKYGIIFYVIMFCFIAQELYNIFIVNHTMLWLKLLVGTLAGISLVFNYLSSTHTYSNDHLKKEKIIKANMLITTLMFIPIMINSYMSYNDWNITFLFYEILLWLLMEHTLLYRLKTIDYYYKLLKGELVNGRID